jgi:hypothetical protein
MLSMSMEATFGPQSLVVIELIRLLLALTGKQNRASM